jgi:hypothetical protein
MDGLFASLFNVLVFVTVISHRSLSLLLNNIVVVVVIVRPLFKRNIYLSLL